MIAAAFLGPADRKLGTTAVAEGEKSIHFLLRKIHVRRIHKKENSALGEMGN
ncbi:hypothetical protein D3C73_1633730 [compost metagenome]